MFEHKRWFRGGRESRTKERASPGSELPREVHRLGGSCGENAQKPRLQGSTRRTGRAAVNGRPRVLGATARRTRRSGPGFRTPNDPDGRIPPRYIYVAPESGELEKEPGDGEDGAEEALIQPLQQPPRRDAAKVRERRRRRVAMTGCGSEDELWGGGASK